MDKKLPALPSLPTEPLRIRPPAAKELIDPLKMLVIKPQEAWLALRDDGQTCRRLFEGHVFVLAAIPAVSGFIGYCLFDEVPLLTGLIFAPAVYVLCVFFMFGATLLAQCTATLLGGKMSLDSAAKLVVYSFMPFFICGIFLLFPPARFGAVLGIYSLYLFYTGLEDMGEIPPNRHFTYCALNLICWILYVDLCSSLLFK